VSEPNVRADLGRAVPQRGARTAGQAGHRLADSHRQRALVALKEPGQAHHGLGLAIVAAIARMHAGSTLADSGGGVTRIGFTLAAPVG
jgi:two-component system heavy metal sensor histidine kinase CusS